MDFIDLFDFSKYFKRAGDTKRAKIGHVNEVIETINNLPPIPTSPYKSYKAYLTQASANAPVAQTVYENTLGFTPTFGANSTGNYSIYCNNGTMIASKTHILITGATGSNALILKVYNWIDGTEYRISSSNGSGTGLSSWGAYIEIKIYN